MHARAIYNVLTQGRAVQKVWPNPQPLWQITPCSSERDFTMKQDSDNKLLQARRK